MHRTTLRYAIEKMSEEEREYWMDWNERFRDPDQEVLDRMRESVRDYENTDMRELRCPVCHRILGEVQTGQQSIVRIFCDNCKSTAPLDLRSFRRQRRRRSAAHRTVR